MIDIRQDLNTRRNFVQVASEHPRACLEPGNNPTAGANWQPTPDHIIGDNVVRDLKDILVVGQTAVTSYGGALVLKLLR